MREIYAYMMLAFIVGDGERSTYQLIREEQYGLEAELPVAEVEQVFEGGAQKIDDHGIVVALGTEPTDERHANASSEGLVHLGFILELGMLGLDGLELDGDLLAGDDVDAQVDVAWRCVSRRRG